MSVLLPSKPMLADPVAVAFRDGNLQLDVPGLGVLAVLDHLHFRRADAGVDVALVGVVLLDARRVLLELRLLVGAAPGDEGQPVLRPVLLHLLGQLAVAQLLVAGELDVADLDLRAFLDVEREVHQLRTGGQFLDLVRDLGELVALLRHHVAHDAFDLADQRGIDERVEPDRDAFFLQLVVDLGLLQLLAADVVHDLDALALLHLEDDALADDAVRVVVVDDLDRQVVEEVGRPEPLEVLEQRLLGLLGVGRPHVSRRPRDLRLDVIEVRLGVDDRRPALPGKGQLDEADQRRRPGGRELPLRWPWPARPGRPPRRARAPASADAPRAPGGRAAAVAGPAAARAPGPARAPGRSSRWRQSQRRGPAPGETWASFLGILPGHPGSSAAGVPKPLSLQDVGRLRPACGRPRPGRRADRPGRRHRDRPRFPRPGGARE